MITDYEIKKLRMDVEDNLTNSCNAAFNEWRTKMLANSITAPERVKLSLERFIEENRPAFFINFKEILRQKIKDKINTLALDAVNTTTQPKIAQGESFDDHKNRVFLEAYILNRGHLRKTSESLGVAKSTLHDWVRDHQELINAELAKTGQALEVKRSEGVEGHCKHCGKFFLRIKRHEPVCKTREGLKAV